MLVSSFRRDYDDLQPSLTHYSRAVPLSSTSNEDDVAIQQLLPGDRPWSCAHPLLRFTVVKRSVRPGSLVSLCQQFLIASLAWLHPPSRAYVEPWTGDLFGDVNAGRDPHVYQASAAQGVHGEVIMERLGNATAKYVFNHRQRCLN